MSRRNELRVIGWNDRPPATREPPPPAKWLESARPRRTFHSVRVAGTWRRAQRGHALRAATRTTRRPTQVPRLCVRALTASHLVAADTVRAYTAGYPMDNGGCRAARGCCGHGKSTVRPVVTKRPTRDAIGRNVRKRRAKSAKTWTVCGGPPTRKIPASGPNLRGEAARLKIVVSPVRVRVSPSGGGDGRVLKDRRPS